MTVLSRIAAALRDAPALGRWRMGLWSAALLLMQAVFFVAVALWSLGFLGPSRPPIQSDFTSFYAAGSLVLQGMPEMAYDQNAHWYAEQAIAGADTPYNYFFYPPPFLLICAGLALLPYRVAYVLFELATLISYIAVASRIAALGGRAWIIPALAFPAVYWCAGLGQNAFLTASLFGAGLLLIDSRPLRAGALLGLLCYKPQFGLLMPVAFAAGGHWRAFFAAGASVVAVVTITAVLFGVETWVSYWQAFSGSGQVYTSGTIMLSGYVTPFGAARLMGWPNAAAMAVQAIVSLAAAGSVAWIWRRQVALPVRAAALMAAALLTVPMAILYDLMLAGVGVAWLVRAGSDTGFLPWEKLLLLLVYLLALLTLIVGLIFHLPLGVFAPAIVLALCVRRALVSGTKPAVADSI